MPIYHPPCKCEALFPKITEKSLRQLQDDLSVELPEDFLDFLRQWNGMRCIVKEFLIPIVGVDENDFPIFCRGWHRPGT